MHRHMHGWRRVFVGIGQSMSNTIWVPWGTYSLQIRTDFGYCDATHYVPVYLCHIYDCSTSHECSNNKLANFSLLTTHFITKSFIIVYVNHSCVCVWNMSFRMSLYNGHLIMKCCSSSTQSRSQSLHIRWPGVSPMYLPVSIRSGSMPQRHWANSARSCLAKFAVK